MTRRLNLFYTILESNNILALVVVDIKGIIYYASLGNSKQLLIDQMMQDFRKFNYTKIMELQESNKHIDTALSNYKSIMENPTLIDSVNKSISYNFIFGTSLQRKVWKYLINNTKASETTHYSSIAAKLDMPNSTRVIGNSIGANRIALLVPCHRVLARSGNISGFRWGVELKKKILNLEARKDKF